MHTFADSENLALHAKATASETQDNYVPELAIDGRYDTRWSGIPGHNSGVWYQLDWDKPVSIGQVILHQYDRFVIELDVQIWRNEQWVTVQHHGKPNVHLPRVVVSEFDPVKTSRLRIGNITNGPSFTEVEVYQMPRVTKPFVQIASDAHGNVIGIATDQWGSDPNEGADIMLSGESKTGHWSASARSDSLGIFSVAMPIGLTGVVLVKATAAGKSAEREFDAAGLQYGLNPIRRDEKVTSLNGSWKFMLDPPTGFESSSYDDAGWTGIKVPAHWEMEGYRSPSSIAGYRKRFRAPAGSGRLMLRFDGVYSGAEVWVNGHRLAYHEGGALPFEIDVTDSIVSGYNVVAVRVTEHTVVSDSLDHMSMYADFHLGGIMRKVILYRVPDVHICALNLATKFDKTYQDATVGGTVSVINQTGSNVTGTINVQVPGVSLEMQPANVSLGPWARSDVPISFVAKSPKKWNAEQPNLYDMTIELRSGSQVVQRLTQRFGFRQTEVRGSEILINGKPAKFKGTCHHDSDPLLGRAVSPELERRDLELMKEANLNALRTSHYPPIPELLDIADELGVYVEDEGSFCWADGSDDLRLTPRIMQMNAEMLARDIDHPCVFMWSICNESGMGFGFWRAHDLMKKIDPSRPFGGSYHRDGDLDIAIRHNPISIPQIDDLEKRLHIPVMWDESLCIYQGIWGDNEELWADPGIRDYYIEPMLAVYDRFAKSPVVSGSQIWCWADDIFCKPGAGLEYGRGDTPGQYADEIYKMPGRGLVGDAPWGVIDGWRRRKPEFWHTKKLHSPVVIKQEMVATGSPLLVEVENRFDFLNLSEIIVLWEIGSKKGSLDARVPPRSKGQLVIPEEGKAGQTLSLTFVDKEARVIDRYKLPIGSAIATPIPAAVAPQPLVVQDVSALNGSTTYIFGNRFDLGFGRDLALLRRGTVDDEAVLLSLPMLHVMPLGKPFDALPNNKTWQPKSFDIKQDGEAVHVSITGAYEHFDGGYDIAIEPNGEVTVHSRFTYSGPEFHAKEIGMRFSVPRPCEELEWDRVAEYSVYPADHIGRQHGDTLAMSPQSPKWPPTWSWSMDNSPLGSNDFRSTKRHINWASLRYPNGPGVCLISDGKQCARAMVDGDRIEMQVSDWYGGSNSRGEWIENYGDGKPIKSGDVIESSVHLRLVGAKK